MLSKGKDLQILSDIDLKILNKLLVVEPSTTLKTGKEAANLSKKKKEEEQSENNFIENAMDDALIMNI